MVRRILALAAVSAAAAALFYTAVAAPGPPSPNAPVNISRPFLQRDYDDETLQVEQLSGSWNQHIHGPIELHYSWLECNVEGKRCSPLAGPGRRQIAPPQTQQIVTLRGRVTATNRFGSTSAATSNFYYDMAGIPFPRGHRRFVYRHLQYDPDQLRALYGLSSEQNGAGQTIVIPDFGLRPGLRASVDRFSAHYGLPKTCGPSRSQDCFHLVISYAGKEPTDVMRDGEAEGDVEWVHAIAPAAKIVVLQFDHAASLFEKVGNLQRLGGASVVSDSWCDPCKGEHSFTRSVVDRHIAVGCHLPHLVCVQAAGDHGSPGDTPSNSPYLLAVGGTKFSAADGATQRQVPWKPSGSGVTDTPLRKPSWQQHLAAGCSRVAGMFSCASRRVPDVSATAATVPIVQPTRRGHGWFLFSGTSLATPLWAALVAITDQQLQQDGQPPVGIDELHRVLYRGDVASGLDDIPPRGWDWSTGLGSPKAGIVDVLAEAIEGYRAGH